jgi:poly(A) polymerase
MNAMFRDPLTGEIHDYFGGQADLRQGIIRAVGDPLTRLREDNLRMLRAIRFAARFGFTIAPDLMDAVITCAAEIRQVSAERIAAELQGVLTSANPVLGLDLLLSSGLLQHVLPQVAALSDSEIDGSSGTSRSLWQSTRSVVEQLTGSSFELMLAGLLHNIGDSTEEQTSFDRTNSLTLDSTLGKAAETVCRKLGLTREQRERVAALVASQEFMHRVHELPVADLVLLLERKDIQDLIALQHAIAVCSASGFPSQRDFLLSKLRELEEEPIESKRLGAKPLVTGKLLHELRFSRGEIFGKIIAQGMRAQREGVFIDTPGAEAWVRKHFTPAVT